MLKRRNESAGNDSFDNRRDGCATVAPFAYLHLNEVRWRLICIRRRRQRIGQRASSAGVFFLPTNFYLHMVLIGFDQVLSVSQSFLLLLHQVFYQLYPVFLGFILFCFFSLGFIGVTQFYRVSLLIAIGDDGFFLPGNFWLNLSSVRFDCLDYVGQLKPTVGRVSFAYLHTNGQWRRRGL